MTKKVIVPVTYEVYGTVEIEVPETFTLDETLEYAKENIDDIHLPYETEYVEDSFRINAESGEELELYNSGKNY